MITIRTSGEKCLCDFTFDFYWQHRGSRFDPDARIDGWSYRSLVDALRRGETVKLVGDAGSRLCSSMGVDLMRLGGGGGAVDVGNVIVDGDVGPRMGISMIRGAIYVSGRVEEPLGNVIEVESDLSGYRRFVSITELVEKGYSPLRPNELSDRVLRISDGISRETIGARNGSPGRIEVFGNAGMSAGILMRAGFLEIHGSSGRNTGVLLSGGTVVVHGDTDDFTATEMRSGEIFVNGNAGGFACARMRGGCVFARECRPVPPARSASPSPEDLRRISKIFGISSIHAMMYRKITV
ncbi:MAG: tributyrin esterase [Methanothrix sp.]|uniref:tributyrin esterase n=1 Tax=Methanothrix sp. TaxID=90426 RepID=UPI0025D5FE50|nr:tributyrin esterase [Methanothrix sp.]MCQ8903223.1 tributyrin esterase [Methanothrix sp.]